MSDIFDAYWSDESSLREVLEDAVAAERAAGRKCSMDALTVLAPQNDPFRQDTDAHHRDGKWLADTLAGLGLGSRQVHNRGMHYMVIGRPKPDGTPYSNDDDNDWAWLSEKASKAARWLGYIPFDQVIDQRNAVPVVREYSKPRPRPLLESGIEIELPSVADVMPRPATHGFRGVQPYHLVFAGEKSSLEPVLDPIAERRGADLYLPTGEFSDTYLHQIAQSALGDDDRPLVVLYFSDADPAGWQMGISVARKLQALSVLVGPFDFRVFRVCLTPDQVRQYNLPSTPLKASEKRGDRWKRLMGTEQTEIDALAALQPDLLRQIATRATAPFYDTGLDQRVREARRDWLRQAAAIIERDTDTDELTRAREDAARQLDGMRQQIADLNERISMDVDDFDFPEFDIPEPELIAIPPEPLIDSDWSFAKQSYHLINSKSYVAGGA